MRDEHARAVKWLQEAAPERALLVIAAAHEVLARHERC